MSRADTNSIQCFGKGWIERGRYSFPFLCLEGTDFEMGEQYGFLAGDLIQEAQKVNRKANSLIIRSMRDWPNWIYKIFCRIIGAVFWLTFPKYTRDQIRGMQSGLRKRSTPIQMSRWEISFGVSHYDILVLFKQWAIQFYSLFPKRPAKTWPTVSVNCNAFALWGKRVIQEKMAFGCNLENSLAGVGMENLLLLSVTKPQGKAPVFSFLFAGHLGVYRGMNSYGVAIGGVEMLMKNPLPTRPFITQVERALTLARSAKELAEHLRTSASPCRAHYYVLADPKQSFALEMSSYYFSIFEENERLPQVQFHTELAMDQRIQDDVIEATGTDENRRRIRKHCADRYQNFEKLILDTPPDLSLDGLLKLTRKSATPLCAIQALFLNEERDVWYSAASWEGEKMRWADQKDFERFPFNRYLIELSVASRESGPLELTIDFLVPTKVQHYQLRSVGPDGNVNGSQSFAISPEISQARLPLQIPFSKEDRLELWEEDLTRLVALHVD